MRGDIDTLCRAVGITRNGRNAAELLADPVARRKLEAALKRRDLAPMVAKLEADERGLLHRPMTVKTRATPPRPQL